MSDTIQVNERTYYEESYLTLANRNAQRREERIKELERMLRWASTFISYAKYELEDGKAVIGDQFPKKDDAQAVIDEISQILQKPCE